MGVKPIYENQLLPNEIKDMTLEEFTEIMTKDNSQANKKKHYEIKRIVWKKVIE